MSEAIQAAWRVAQSESGAARLVGQADPELLYESAERALSSGEWLRVVSICGQLLEIDPAHPDALQLLILAHQALRRERGEPPTPIAAPAVRPVVEPPTARRDMAAGPPTPRTSAASVEPFGTAENLYADAGADINAERWDAAADKLAALSSFAPEYRDVATLRRDIAIQQRRETQLAAWYAEAVAAETRRDWPDALAAYQQILGEAPSYRDVVARVDAAEQEWALDQGLTSARSTLAAGRAEEAIALIETLMSSAPHSARQGRCWRRRARGVPSRQRSHKRPWMCRSISLLVARRGDPAQQHARAPAARSRDNSMDTGSGPDRAVGTRVVRCKRPVGYTIQA